MIVCGGTSTLLGDVIFSIAWRLSHWVSSTPGWGRLAACHAAWLTTASSD